MVGQRFTDTHVVLIRPTQLTWLQRGLPKDHTEARAIAVYG